MTAYGRTIYTAHAHVTGGRAAGHGRTWEGALEVDLSAPLEMSRNPIGRGGSYQALGISGAALFAVFLFLTYYMQLTKGFSPIETGLACPADDSGDLLGAAVGAAAGRLSLQGSAAGPARSATLGWSRRGRTSTSPSVLRLAPRWLWWCLGGAERSRGP